MLGRRGSRLCFRIRERHVSGFEWELYMKLGTVDIGTVFRRTLDGDTSVQILQNLLFFIWSGSKLHLRIWRVSSIITNACFQTPLL